MAVVTDTPAGLTARQARQARERWRIAGRILRHAVLIAISAVFLVPWFWMISTSLKALREVMVFPPIWIPNPLHWDNYWRALTVVPMGQYAWNTVFYAVATSAGAVVSNTISAYGFSRLRWPGRDIVFILVISTMIVPYQVTLIPLYVIFNKLHWINTYYPLILPSWLGSAFFVFLLRQFFMTIPEELSDAARIDGCSEIAILWRIILPLAQPALAVVALFQFIGAWTDFLGPLIYLTDQTKYTLSLGLAEMQGSYGFTDFPAIMAASAVTILPIVILFFVTQRTFVQGITLTGIKG
jgi:multiple sugar transport system permease protein